MPEVAPTLRFALAGPDEVDELVALIESAYRGDSSRVGWTTEADLLEGHRTDADGVRAVLADPDSLMVLARDVSDHSVLACCQLERRAGSAYFGMFAVRPRLQGRGIGKAVLVEAERVVVQEWAVPRMEMTVIRQRDELIAWYERRGYVRTGDLSPFPYGQERFGIPQRDDLVFETLAKELTVPGPGAVWTPGAR